MCRRLTEGKNPYFGERTIERLRRRLEAGLPDPATEIAFRGRLVHGLIRLGRFQEAQTAARRLLELVDVSGLENEKGARRATLEHLAIALFLAAEDANCLADHRSTSCIVPFASDALHVKRADTRAAGDLYARLLKLEPTAPRWRWLLNLSRVLSNDYPEAVPSAQRLPKDALRSPAAFSAWPEVASAAGVAAFDLAGGAIMDDFDGDGLLDLVSSTMDPCDGMKAFRNRGNGTFSEVSEAGGLDAQLGALNIVHADYDNDGLLDILALRGGWLGDDGRLRNSLLHNDLKRSGRFVDVTAAAGIAFPAYPTQTAAWADYDGDGDLDLFVAAYQAPIDEVIASYVDGSSSSDHAPVLYRNDGGRFTDVSAEVGLDRPLLPMGANHGDLDNDGWPDVALGTGTPDFAAIMPNVLYRNDAGRFRDVTFASGFGSLQKGHGVAFGDLDHDGDQDLFQQLGGALPYDQYFNALYVNPGNGNHWITLLLRGREANRSGIGARIAVTVRDGETRRTIHALAGSGGSFGGSSLRQEIGLGHAEAIESVSILWPGSGTRDVFRDVPLDRAWRAVEGAEVLEPVVLPSFELSGESGHAGADHHGGARR